MLKINRFHLAPVKRSAHGSLSKSKGTIGYPYLARITEEEIVSELADQNVTAAHRITVCRDGIKRSTNTTILTLPFRIMPLPEALKVGYLNATADMYIPNPLRCYSCYKFDLHERKC